MSMVDAGGLQTDSHPVIELAEIGKVFGATRALDGVSLAVRAGETRALLGENGAGKSTCVKILNGIVRPDTGRMTLLGEDFRPRNMRDAQGGGVATAFQELSLLPNFSVGLNLALPGPPRTRVGRLDWKRIRQDAERILTSYGIDNVNPSVRVDALSLADKQRVEIVRALYRRPRLLVLDEPTAALADVSWLYEQVRRAADDGAAVLFISHRMREVRDLCDRATVLRNGRLIHTVALENVTDSYLFELMIGKRRGEEAGEGQNSRRAAELGSPSVPAMRVRDMRADGVGPLSFDISPGEILGVAALEGQGQRELFNSLAGNSTTARGQTEMFGETVHINSPVKARSLGIGFVPEERKADALFFGLPTSANISISRLGAVSSFGMLLPNTEGERLLSVAGEVDLESRYLRFPIEALSGGNQQKAVIARALLLGGRVLLLFDPTRGVDIGTKEAIYAAIERAAGKGCAVLYYSTELREITRLASRCMVLYHGEIIREVGHSELEETRLIDLMHGQTVDAKNAS